MATTGLTHWADILTVIVYFAFVLGVGVWVCLFISIFGVKCMPGYYEDVIIRNILKKLLNKFTK